MEQYFDYLVMALIREIKFDRIGNHKHCCLSKMKGLLSIKQDISIGVCLIRLKYFGKSPLEKELIVADIAHFINELLSIKNLLQNTN